jgi:hypothetical protein
MPVLVLALTGLLSAIVPVQEPAAPIELPGDARDALEDKWRDWAPATLPGDPACLKDGATPVSLVRADLDSDGHADFALAVQTGGAVRLAAVLYRVPEYVVFDLDELGGTPAAATLAVAPRASMFTPAGALPDFFPADTILVRRCGQPDVAYLWTGFSFRKTPMATGTAAELLTR